LEPRKLVARKRDKKKRVQKGRRSGQGETQQDIKSRGGCVRAREEGSGKQRKGGDSKEGVTSEGEEEIRELGRQWEGRKRPTRCRLGAKWPGQDSQRRTGHVGAEG